MGDVESLAQLLRHPEDLDKIPALKAEFSRKKAAVDGQLRHGLREQLELTQAGMNSITEGQRTVNLIKEEMMKIDKLCAEAQNMIRDFPHINLVAQTHRNFEAVEKMKAELAKGTSKSEFHVFPNSGHAFHADYRPSYVAADAEEGWKRCVGWFKRYLEA